MLPVVLKDTKGVPRVRVCIIYEISSVVKTCCYAQIVVKVPLPMAVVKMQ